MKRATKSPGADVRIVVISSNAQHAVLPANYKLDFTTPDILYGKLPYEPFMYKAARGLVFNVNMLHYGVSKLANAMFAKQLQRLLNEQQVPIAVLSLHPGGVMSEKVHKVFKPYFWPLISGGFVTPDVGSFNVLFAATAEDVREQARKYLGNYIEPTGVVHPGHRLLHDEVQARGLWEVTQQETERYLASKGGIVMSEW